MERVTWQELVRREPRLGKLHEEIKAVRDEGEAFCANDLWYGYYGSRSFKQEMMRLVGWTSGQDDVALRSTEAYRVAYENLYWHLPDCRHAGSCGFHSLIPEVSQGAN